MDLKTYFLNGFSINRIKQNKKIKINVGIKVLLLSKTKQKKVTNTNKSLEKLAVLQTVKG